MKVIELSNSLHHEDRRFEEIIVPAALRVSDRKENPSHNHRTNWASEELPGQANQHGVTHEEHLHQIRNIAVSRLNDEAKQRLLLEAKLTYGSGRPGVRGICFYKAWQNGSHHEFIEISASCEQSDLQLAGTTFHELAHILAGSTAGHGPEWKLAAHNLGLVCAEAAGQEYKIEDFDPEVWAKIAAVPSPSDGRPAFAVQNGAGVGFGPTAFIGLPRAAKVRPCPLGIGKRNGKSRGPGAGSRLRLYACACQKPLVSKVRVASDTFRAICRNCETEFTRQNAPSKKIPNQEGNTHASY
jgi:predicted SprT family Zn-dependent metalloprotease